MLIRKVGLFIILLFVLFNKGNGNDTSYNKIQDSLLSKIIFENNSEKKVEYYYELVRFYQNNNATKAIEFAEIALGISNKLNKPLLSAKMELELIHSHVQNSENKLALQWLDSIKPKTDSLKDPFISGLFYYVQEVAFNNIGSFSEAMTSSFEALNYFTKAADSLWIGKTHNSIGINYDVTGNNQMALEHYFLARDFALPSNDPILISDIYNNIGVILNKLGNGQEALQNYYKSLEISYRIGDLGGSAIIFNNIASVLHKMGRYDEASIYFQKALKQASDIGDKDTYAFLLGNISSFFMISNQPDSAYPMLMKSIELHKMLNDSYGLADNYIGLGIYYTKKHNPVKAIASFKKGNRYAQLSKVPELQISAMNKISETMANMGNYKDAYEYKTDADKIRDSLSEVENLEKFKLTELQLNFKNLQLNYKDELAKQDISYSSAINKEKRTRYFFIIILFFILFVVVLVLNSSNKLKIANKALMAKNKEIEQQKAFIEISNTELKEQYAFTHTLLDTIPNPVFYTDNHNNILGCNYAFEQLTGKTNDRLAGLNLTELNLKTNLHCEPSKLFAFNPPGLNKNEGSIFTQSSLPRDVICFRNGIFNEKQQLESILGIIIDITEIREAERSLQQSEQMLKEALVAKDKFFNIMAHDLKNPFNAVLGLTSLISSNYQDFSSEDIKQYITQINKSASHIYSLLENILEWARTQSGAINFNPGTVSVNETVTQCIDLFRQSLDLKSLTVNVEVPKSTFVFVDKNMIMTVFRNLISNAIKFTPINGQITISAKETRLFAIVTVSDSGIGISKDNIDKLFKVDQPVSTPGLDKEQGTGLGLILCKEFITMNGGQIEVKSTLNKGTSFILTIPLAT